jgi:hypothetical protein
MLTHIKDIDDQILLQLDAKTLLSFHYVNKVSNKYFDIPFWKNKFNYSKIPIMNETTLHEYIKGTRCVKLVKMLFIIADLDKKDDIYIVLGQCKLKTILLNTPLTELYEKIAQFTYLDNLVIRIQQYNNNEYCSEILKYPSARIGGKNENFCRDITLNTLFLLLYKAFYYNLLVDDNDNVPFIIEDRDFHCNVYSMEKYYYERYGQYQLLNYIPDAMFISLYNNLMLY